MNIAQGPVLSFIYMYTYPFHQPRLIWKWHTFFAQFSNPLLDQGAYNIVAGSLVGPG